MPYTPEQDGVAERANRTILNQCRTLINALAEDEDDEDPRDPKTLWPEIMRTTIYLTNRLATRSLYDKTPIEALTTNIGQPTVPDLSHLRTIGCKAYYYIPKEKRQRRAKFENRAKAGILVGYEGNSIYRIYDKDRGIVRASAVVFDENDAPNIEVQFDDLFNDTYTGGAAQDDQNDTQEEDGAHEGRGQQPAQESQLHDKQLSIPRGFQDENHAGFEDQNQGLINNQDSAPNYLLQLRKPRQKPTIIPTAASSRPIRNRDGDPNKKRL